MPTRAATWSVKFGLGTTWAAMPISGMATPMPARAITTGKPAARTEPNTTSSTTRAATTPMTSPFGALPDSKESPLKATVRPDGRARCSMAVAVWPGWLLGLSASVNGA